MFTYENGKVFESEAWSKVLSTTEQKNGGDCVKALDDLGFYLSSEYYPKQNIEGLGLEIYASNCAHPMSKKYSFLAVMSACDTSMQYVLIEDIFSLWKLLAEYLPVVKLASETMIDRETHYEQV